MPITFACSCGANLRAPDDAVGKTVACPKCKARVIVPTLNARDSRPREPEPRYDAPPRRRRRPDPEEEPDALPPGRLSRCPYCRSTFPPLMKKRISPGGWVVFGVVLAMG